MKKLLFSCMAIVALAMFALTPPMSANAAGFYAPIDIGQVHAQSISDPYKGDITGDLTVSPIEKYVIVNPSGDGGSAGLNFGTTAVLSVKAHLSKGGGFFGTGSES